MRLPFGVPAARLQKFTLSHPLKRLLRVIFSQENCQNWHLEPGYNFVIIIPQSDTERLLEEHLAAFGLKAERQVELKQFESSVDGVSCILLHPQWSGRNRRGIMADRLRWCS